MVDILDWPDEIVIPHQVLTDKDICGPAKMHYGVLKALPKTEGYLWHEDQEYADLYGVCRATIERWHRELEFFGYIKRLRHNVPYRREDGVKVWKLERKLHVEGV